MLDEILFNGYWHWFWFICLAIVAVIVLAKKKKLKIDTLLVLGFIVCFLAFLPAFFLKSNSPYDAFSSLIYSFRVFKGDFNYHEYIGEVGSMGASMPLSLNVPYKILITILYIGAPVLTGAFIISLLKEKIKSLRILFCTFGRVYIFSELNEKSLRLAKSVTGDERARIIFSGCHCDDQQLLERCAKYKAIVTAKTPEWVYKNANRFTKWWWLLKKRKLIVYLTDNDESAALNKMIYFIQSCVEDKKKLPDTYIFLFSMLPLAELCVDKYKADINKGKITSNVMLRLIDPAQLISYMILDEYPLYMSDAMKDDNVFNVTVIGTGNIGTHIAKDVLWCGQLPETSLELSLVDCRAEEDTKACFEYLYPELNEANYKIHYYQADAESVKFDELLKSDKNISNSGYFVVATGDDERNISVAHNIRMKYYRYHGKFPQIVAVICEYGNYSGIKNIFEKLNIFIAGRDSEIYSKNAISDHSLYTKALKVNNVYRECNGAPSIEMTEFMNDKEYRIRSSMANALHVDYKLWQYNKEEMRIIKDNASSELEKEAARDKIKAWFRGLSEDDIDKLNEFEHVKWIAFQRSEGWVSPFGGGSGLEQQMQEFKTKNRKNVDERIDYEQDPDKPKLQQCIFAKIHGCIIPYKDLAGLGKVIKGNEQEFLNNDEAINRAMIEIWEADR